MSAADRRERLRRARLYFVTDLGPGYAAVVESALAGGADMVQLRDKTASDEDIVRAAEAFRGACSAHAALFWLNDRPDLVEACGADGVHVGQGDLALSEVRRLVGPDVLVGLSTHEPAQLEAALAATLADQLSVGPVWETPTKEGRPAAGLSYVRLAAELVGERVPWFAIGGIDLDNVHEVIAAGARRVVVVRAIRDASDPRAAAAALAAALPPPAAQGTHGPKVA